MNYTSKRVACLFFCFLLLSLPSLLSAICPQDRHLIPSPSEKAAVMQLDFDGDGVINSEDSDIDGDDIANSKDKDIDGDGRDNESDPSPYDWREKGFSPFGVLAFLSWNHSWNNYKYSSSDLEKAVKMFKNLGIDYVRFDFYWEDIEPHKGEFSFSKYDYIVKLLRKNNIRILGILDYSASWAAKSWNAPPFSYEDFANFVKKVVGRYKNYIKYWEIWNEPNSYTYLAVRDSMKTYTQLLKSAYRAAKEADASCKIVLGGLAREAPYALADIYRQGGRGYFDIVNIHPFVNPLRFRWQKEIEVIYNNLLKVMRRYHDENKHIWVTEIGCPGIKSYKDSQGWWEGRSPNFSQQAVFLKKVYLKLLKLPHIDKVFWAFFRDCKEHFKSDVDYFGLVDWQFRPKKAFFYYRWLIRELKSKARRDKQ